MSQPFGQLCIVLHGHLPYVLRHGSYPHGEAWLYEAVAETYLPLLETIAELAEHRVYPALTIGLSPVLLEQLASDYFKAGFVAYLNERIAHAAEDLREFEKSGDSHRASMARRWIDWYAAKLDQFKRLNRDVVARFAHWWHADRIQLLTSAATHAYLPLLLNDQMISAQMTLGAMTSEKHLGKRPSGLWLPECAYRPAVATWFPAVLYDNVRNRPGLELFINNAGLTHFFIDSHQFGRADPLEPVGVISEPNEQAKCFAFARHPRVAEHVWSSIIGYPGAGEYLEFHRKHRERGLRYHKITSVATPLSDKLPYVPEDTFTKLYEHSQHFCAVVRETLREFQQRTGRAGTVVASFDAELFGHWWFEGPQFLRDVIYTISRDPQIKLITAEQALAFCPCDKAMRLGEGSWGRNGNHGVWLNDKIRWMWEIEYRAEGNFLKLLHALPWRQNNQLREVLDRAARELLLMQASDWPFVIDSKGAVDYGIQRFAGHATGFNRMLSIAESLAVGNALDPLQRVEIEELDAHDALFSAIDLNWWF